MLNSSVTHSSKIPQTRYGNDKLDTFCLAPARGPSTKRVMKTYTNSKDEDSDRFSKISIGDIELTDVLNYKYIRITPHILRQSSPW